MIDTSGIAILDRPRSRELFARYAGNPILAAGDWPYPINVTFNPAATLLADGTTLLLCRIEGQDGSSHLCAARSGNGFDGWEIDREPSLAPDVEGHPEEEWGIEDARISYVPEIGRYAVTYTSYSPIGPGVSLALTSDFRSFERLGQILPPENKDAALFPRRIGGQWAMIHRPVIASTRAHIWVSYSPDLVHWGRHKIVLAARPGPWWDSDRVGLASPPIETEEGWLVIYHGVKRSVAGAIYRVGLALLDPEDPQRCIARSKSWVMTAETPYELIGDIHNVVFPCGHTLDPVDGDTLNLYYGGADSCVAVATGSVRGMLEFLRSDS
ncbi:MAG: glycoside hydrolase family 130 protein [Chloroflexota bacterium]